MISAGSVMLFIAAIALIVFIIYSAILAYHWVRYGFGFPLVWAAALVYGIGSALILSVLFAATNAL